MKVKLKPFSPEDFYPASPLFSPQPTGGKKFSATELVSITTLLVGITAAIGWVYYDAERRKRPIKIISKNNDRKDQA